jgi:hypothetical protein
MIDFTRTHLPMGTVLPFNVHFVKLFRCISCKKIVWVYWHFYRRHKPLYYCHDCTMRLYADET